MAYQAMTDEERVSRFKSKLVLSDSGCLEYSGPRHTKGYGRVYLRFTEILAHRIAWEIEHGPIPHGMAVCHRCDNPPCCNPEHLFLGTIKDNSLDMLRKGRGCIFGNRWTGYGKSWPKNSIQKTRENRAASRIKLTPDDVHAIRNAYSKGGMSYDDLATLFGKPRTQIFSALNKWKTLETK